MLEPETEGHYPLGSAFIEFDRRAREVIPPLYGRDQSNQAATRPAEINSPSLP